MRYMPSWSEPGKVGFWYGKPPSAPGAGVLVITAPATTPAPLRGTWPTTPYRAVTRGGVRLAGLMPVGGIRPPRDAAAGFGTQPPAGQATGTAYTVPPWIGRPPGTPPSHRTPNTPPTPGKPAGDGTGEPGANLGWSCTFTVVTRSAWA